MDDSGNDLRVYNQGQGGLAQWETQRINDNEQLIGIYGVHDVQDHITTLGFIVKVDQIR